MRAHVPAVIAIAALLTGCAFVPKHNERLEEARAAYAEAESDAGVARHAAPELRAAGELLERATYARDTLDDTAHADHLAYLAKQRAAIARQAALLREASSSPLPGPLPRERENR